MLVRGRQAFIDDLVKRQVPPRSLTIAEVPYPRRSEGSYLADGQRAHSRPILG
jgi:hypothetical protein